MFLNTTSRGEMVRGSIPQTEHAHFGLSRDVPVWPKIHQALQNVFFLLCSPLLPLLPLRGAETNLVHKQAKGMQPDGQRLFLFNRYVRKQELA